MAPLACVNEGKNTSRPIDEEEMTIAPKEINAAALKQSAAQSKGETPMMQGRVLPMKRDA
jgi:hypothetical protein